MCLSFTHSKFKIDNVNKSNLHYQLILKKFLDNLKFKQLSDEYIYSNKKALKNFEKYLMINDVSHISKITKDNIFNYISTLSKYSQSYKYDIVSKIRIFLKFMYLSNFTSVDFTLAIPKIKINHNNKIPHTIWSADEIKKILNSIDTTTKDGKRDYAIFMILTHLGLRFSDVKNLRFQDIDWQRNILNISQNKTGKVVILPLLDYYIAIDKKVFKKDIKAKYGELVKIDPYLHSFSEIYTAICNNMKDKESSSMIFLDKQLNFNKELSSFFPEIHQKYVDNIIEYPMFLDSDSTNYIQIADILSFYVNKYYSIQNGYQKYGEEKEKHCLAMFKELSKNTIVSIKNFE